MKIKKLLPLIVLSSSLFGQGYFAAHSDICKIKSVCPNKTELVTKLQRLLGSDVALHQKLEVTGEFDQKTFDAVVAFQKYYKITPADGWVGSSTKAVLDKVYEKKRLIRPQKAMNKYKDKKNKMLTTANHKANIKAEENKKWAP